MLELMDWAILVVIIGFSSAFFGLIFGFAMAYFRDNALTRRVTALEKDFDSLVDSVNGKQGQTVKQEKAARLQNGIIKAGLQVKAAMEQKMPPEQIFKELGPKIVSDFLIENPEVAVEAARKGLKSL